MYLSPTMTSKIDIYLTNYHNNCMHCDSDVYFWIVREEWNHWLEDLLYWWSYFNKILKFIIIIINSNITLRILLNDMILFVYTYFVGCYGVKVGFFCLFGKLCAAQGCSKYKSCYKFHRNFNYFQKYNFDSSGGFNIFFWRVLKA